MSKSYSPYDDYCEEARAKQSVPTKNEVLTAHPEYSEADILKERSNCYPCADTYEMGTIRDNHIFISTTDAQHEQALQHQRPEKLSNFFSDQDTINACSHNGTLDNTSYNQACQMQSWRKGGLDGTGDASYKPHVDCFEINRDNLQKEYGTRDFNAAIAKCEANNQFGAGGGNQGYNPYISEMIGNRCLEIKPEGGYSDRSFDSKHYNANQLNNSKVNELDYKDMTNAANNRTNDCISNNTHHPSTEACKNGFNIEEGKNLVDSKTGHATPVNMKPSESEIADAKQNGVDISDMFSNSTNDNSNALSAGVGHSTINSGVTL